MEGSKDYLIANQLSKEEFPLLVLTIENDTCVPYRNVFQILHKHEEIEFLLVVRNKLHVQTTTSEFIVNEGEAVFIPKNTLHILDTFGNCSCKAILFPDDLLIPSTYKSVYDEVKLITDNPLLDLVFIQQEGRESDIVDSLQLLINTAMENKPYDVLSALYKLWSVFTDSIDIEDRLVVQSVKAKGDCLKNYLEFIHLNYHLPIDIKSIADASFTSVSECNRIFKSILKVTAYDYLIKFRINKSMELLKINQEPIAEIAHLVGYNSPSQFTKAFKKLINKTPTEYIRSMDV